MESFLSLGACIVIVMASGSGGQNGGILCIMARRPFVRRVVRMTYRDGRGSIEEVRQHHVNQIIADACTFGPYRDLHTFLRSLICTNRK